MGDNNNCSICLDQCNRPLMTGCGHTFCERCIKGWIHRQIFELEVDPLCPLCKKAIRRSELKSVADPAAAFQVPNDDEGMNQRENNTPSTSNTNTAEAENLAARDTLTIFVSENFNDIRIFDPDNESKHFRYRKLVCSADKMDVEIHTSNQINIDPSGNVFIGARNERGGIHCIAKELAISRDTFNPNHNEMNNGGSTIQQNQSQISFNHSDKVFMANSMEILYSFQESNCPKLFFNFKKINIQIFQ